EVAESEGGSAQVFEAAVDGLGGSVGGAGPIEVGQHVGGALFQCPSEGDQFLQRFGNAGAERGDQCLHHGPASVAVRVTVGGHGPLVGTPGGLDLGVGIDG